VGPSNRLLFNSCSTSLYGSVQSASFRHELMYFCSDLNRYGYPVAPCPRVVVQSTVAFGHQSCLRVALDDDCCPSAKFSRGSSLTPARMPSLPHSCEDVAANSPDPFIEGLENRSLEPSPTWTYSFSSKEVSCGGPLFPAVILLPFTFPSFTLVHFPHNHILLPSPSDTHIGTLSQNSLRQHISLPEGCL